jgi:hypothetical protein
MRRILSTAALACQTTRNLLIEQRADKSFKGMRWPLLKDRSNLKPEVAADLDAFRDPPQPGGARAGSRENPDVTFQGN